jgi:hypothetical protein
MRVLVDLQTQSRKHTAKCGTRDEARREVPPKATHDALTLYSPNNHNHAHPAHAHRQDRRAGSLSLRSCCARLRGHGGKRGSKQPHQANKKEGRTTTTMTTMTTRTRRVQGTTASPLLLLLVCSLLVAATQAFFAAAPTNSFLMRPRGALVGKAGRRVESSSSSSSVCSRRMARGDVKVGFGLSAAGCWCQRLG